MDCEYLEKCGFYRQFGQRRSNVWKGLVSHYCKGNGCLMCECRKHYRETGVFPDGQMLPIGKEVPRAFLSLP